MQVSIPVEVLFVVFVMGMATGQLVPKTLSLLREAIPAIARVLVVMGVAGLALFGAYNAAPALLH